MNFVEDKGHTPEQALYMALRRVDIYKSTKTTVEVAKTDLLNLLAIVYETVARAGAAAEAFLGRDAFGKKCAGCGDWFGMSVCIYGWMDVYMYGCMDVFTYVCRNM